MKFDINNAIRHSRVHVIILSKSLAASKQCLDEIVEIMNISSCKTPSEVTVLPVFYDVAPFVVRRQPEGSAYDLQNVKGSTDEERKRWAKALYDLSCLKGFEFFTDRQTTYQWEELNKIASKVEAFLNKEAISYADQQKCENLYQEKLNEVSKVLKSEDFNSKDVFFLGVYERNKPRFAELILHKFRGQFDAFCFLSNAMVEGSDSDSLVRKLYSDLIRKPKQELLPLNDVKRTYRSYYQQLLRNKRCFVVFSFIANNIDDMKPSLQVVRENLKNKSLVVFVSRFQHLLQKVLKIDKFISLSLLDDNRGIVTICYGNKRDINEAFIDHLQETFSMVGLDVHLESKERFSIDSTSLQKSEVVLCIVSQSFSIGEFEGILLNAAPHRPRVLYVLYGPHCTSESTSKSCFNIRVNFEESELKKAEFQMMVNEVLQTLKERREEMKEITDFPVGLTKRVNDMWAQMSNYLYSSNNAPQCFGLLGMGGVGKTTTAMSIYNKIRNQFEGSFFCLNTSARVAADASRLVSLQREMLQSLLSEKQYQDGRIRSAAHEEAFLSSYRMDPTEKHDQGGRIQSAACHGEARLSACRMDLTNDDEVHEKALLSSKLRGINALVVLDDVDSIAQLEVLYNPICSSLGANSLVLITSRNRKILEHAQSRHIFDIEELSEESSQRLFNWHAFLKPEAPPHLKEVSESVIGACKGLPLSLKVMGAHLYYESDKRYWDESLHFLRTNEKDIFSVLRRSLDRVESDQRDAFLDISCFLVGENDVVSCAYLEGAYGRGWTHLKDLNSRCLLTLEREEGKWLCDTKDRIIGMHDQLRDMGRHVVRKEERNRAWDAESAKLLLKVRCLCFLIQNMNVCPVDRNFFNWFLWNTAKRMRLRVLHCVAFQ
ncbi:hypothetical protein KP509_15G002300 [Ceratopteris richardii]|nr:hypothetical protein KP509_15G002300 [Ceratopteris richardii]